VEAALAIMRALAEEIDARACDSDRHGSPAGGV